MVHLVGRLWRLFRSPSARFSLGLLLIVGFVGGVVFLSGFNWGLELTNNETFCRGCHEMNDNVYPEYRGTIHDQNRTGVRATCPDCHVPHEFLPKMKRKLQASNEVLNKLLGTIDTREKFENHRLELELHEWTRMKESDSHTCRSCHNFAAMDLSRQGPRARLRHTQAAEQGQTCIDCHKGIAHQLATGALDAEKVFNEQWAVSHPQPAKQEGH
ncbi:MAG TPA: NapC/NirT family cytochrome c [Patescibacteria group bacterium]|nr:NapC/NirT family cytochrome c [Patescibacteria group bacterium]